MIVDKDHAVADENGVFDGDAFAEEGVARDFAMGADFHAFLNFHESANFGVVPDFAAVEINEGEDLDMVADFDIGSDSLVTGEGRDHREAEEPLCWLRWLSRLSRLSRLRWAGGSGWKADREAWEKLMGAPWDFRDWEEASRMRTRLRPLLPSLRGVESFWMQSKKCWHSTLRGSSCLILGMKISP